MKEALTWDDIALVPQYNNVVSRGEPTVKTWLTKNRETKIPLIPSNMDTVISPDLSAAMEFWGGDTILHRFHQDEDLGALIKGPYGRPVCVSWGLRDWEGLRDLLDGFTTSPLVWGVCLDVAHGHCEQMFKMIRRVANEFGDRYEIIAGNVCTPLGYHELASHGATAVKVGIGTGAACSTRAVTGFGVPQFTAIRDCAVLAEKLRVPIIADGGIRDSRDVVLALAAGASTVMIGKLFAATEESAAEKKKQTACDGWEAKWVAKYRGQASFDFQQEFYGKCEHVPEGEAFWVPVTGSAHAVIGGLVGGIKSGMTYAGARSIKELQRKAEFVRVTSTYLNESKTRPD